MVNLRPQFTRRGEISVIVALAKLLRDLARPARSLRPPDNRELRTDNSNKLYAFRMKKPKSLNVFAFHKPETLLEYLEPNANLNTRLANLLTADQMPTTNLWSAQIEAIRNLEKSLAADLPFYQIRSFTKCWARMTLVLARSIVLFGLSTVHGYSPLKLHSRRIDGAQGAPRLFVRGAQLAKSVR